MSKSTLHLNFDNSYSRLSETCFSRQQPDRPAHAQWVRFNDDLAADLGLAEGAGTSAAALDLCSGRSLPNTACAIATVYAGHQFGQWNPRLGDGRAILIGEHITPDGRRFDLQLKGAGQTAYSRGGDGKSPLGPVLREYLVSEAMAALGVPTTRALAAVSTGDTVFRDRALPGAVLTRVASSHIRIGTMQYFAARGELETLGALVDYTLARHFPQADSSVNKAAALLQCVIGRQAKLIAQWQSLGFIHGVMNTDNMLLCGETIDYGPCAFMDNYRATQVFSSIDHRGRYAYRNQAAIAHWNLAQLAQSLLPLLNEDSDRAVALAQDCVDQFPEQYTTAWRRHMGDKFGIAATAADDTLMQDFLALLESESSDFTLAFNALTAKLKPAAAAPHTPLGSAFEGWLQRWELRLSEEPNAEVSLARMRGANPLLIPRNHWIERCINEATTQQDFTLFHELAENLVKPFEEPQAAATRFQEPPAAEEVVLQTFCGT